MSEPKPEILLRLDQVTTYYGQMRILEGISLHVDEGELVCLLGGNASGQVDDAEDHPGDRPAARRTGAARTART